MSDEARFDRIDHDIAAIHTQLGNVDGRLGGIEGRVAGIEGRVTGIEDRVTGLESGQTELVRTVAGIDHRLTKVEITQEAMRDDIKLLAEGLAATNAAIERSADRVIAYIDERISPIQQAVRHLSR
jgi:hypothetical protein